MSEKLDRKQTELDAMEKQLVENKIARVDLSEKARELRGRYLAAQEEREQLLKEELQGGAE